MKESPVRTECGVDIYPNGKCNPKYSLEGNETIRCQDGVWSGHLPQCKDTPCEDPGVPSNGKRLRSDFGHEKTVAFQCNPKYSLVGNETIRCQDGVWSGHLPQCKGVPSNGKRLRSDFGHEKTVAFQCNPKYSLVGNETIRCQDGVWSGHLPRCKAPCVDPGVPSNGRRLDSDFGHEKTVAFQCNPKYSLVGNETIRCQDGVWSGHLPQCKAPCEDPGVPSNGKRLRSDFGHEKTVAFQCNPKYSLVGNETIRCQDGVWSGHLPRCKAPCVDPGVPSNGRRLDSDFGHEKTVAFQCNPKYSLVGNETIRCQDGVWSGHLPQCKAPCEDPGVPSNGKRLRSDFGHEKTVAFQCNPKYSLEGNETIRCQDGVWSGHLPQCKAPCVDPGVPSNGRRLDSDFGHEKTVAFQCNPKYSLVGNEQSAVRTESPCEDPGVPSNGKRLRSDFGHEKTVAFQCNPKYSLVGNETIRCQDGVWSGHLPRCKAPCVDPGVPSNGRRLDSDFGHEKTVAFQCNPKYSLVGNETIRCQDGVWSGHLPQCKAPCEDPGVPSNGKRLRSDFGHEKTVAFQCNPKYSLEGNETIRCQDGVWSGHLPQCKAPCVDPGVPSNGRRLDSDFGHEKTVAFQCNPKYSLVGNETIRCQDGVWSGHLPQCKAPCEDPGVPSNGKRLRSDFGHEKTVAFQCNPKYSLVEMKQSAVRTECGVDIYPKKTVAFQCNPKYSLVGNETIRCQDGVWSGHLPQCKAPCEDPGVPSNGKRLRSDFGHEKTVAFQCNPKYSLVGNETIRCQDGVWSGHLPQCKAPCEDPGVPSNGKRLRSDFGHEKTVAFQCNPKYSLVGNETIRCQDGVWSGHLPQSPCEDPGVPSNGKRLRSDFGHEKTVAFQCNPKYSLVGNETIRCQDGVWSGHLPRCKAPCVDPGVPSNGRRLDSDFGHEKTVAFQCNPKYSLVGNETIRCQDGVWSGHLPQCKAPCEDPGVPSNGKRLRSDFGHEKTVAFQCNPKYSLVGNETIRCQDGVWSGHLPQCKAPCEDPGVPSNGKRLRSDFGHEKTVAFQCNPKYSLVGNETIRCQDGVWSGHLPQCKAPCEDPGVPSNGKRLRSDFGHEKTVAFQCNPKYSLVGNETIRCQDGVWSGHLPQCKAPCEDPGVPSNGKRLRSDFGHEKTVAFQCNPKYSLVGNETIRCQDGVWSGHLPQCKAPCEDPGVPSNGKRLRSDFGHEKTVAFQCNPKYSLVGNETIRCQDGVWSGHLPQCKAPCEDPGVPSNGKRLRSDFGHEKTVAFQCNPKYSLVGNETIRCQDGVWSGHLPRCKAPCVDPGVPSNGRRLDSDFGHEKTVAFQCNPKYSLVGNETIRCQDGVWSGHLPQCKAPCEDPGVPSNGKRLRSDFGHEKTVAFQCNPKYSLVGNETIRCQDGVWSGHLPQCKAPCEDPGVPSNGKRLRSDFGHEKTVAFQCNLKYSLVGNETIRCQDGVWSGHLPRCKAPCEDPGVPSNGKRLRSDFGHEKTVAFQCNPKYSLVGNETIRCQDGGWSGHLPQCRSPCLDPGVPSNGRRLASGFGHEKTVTFQCNLKYSLVGNERIRCQDGVWSGQLPQCKAPCVDPGVPSNGRRLRSDFGHEKTVTFLCNPKYSLLGNETMRCQDGVWSGHLPQCKPITNLFIY
ncbi:complement receptor type 1-like [Montipora foliosa]|uniref:complement receptor type 1-like n=1 Tax=Montipora foliosa TaxID=591990 RepID=UPI0035F178EE